MASTQPRLTAMLTTTRHPVQPQHHHLAAAHLHLHRLLSPTLTTTRLHPLLPAARLFLLRTREATWTPSSRN